MNTRVPNSQSRLSALGQTARTGDYDRFLTTLFAPPEKREALCALIAFNLEIAHIRDAVREPMLGHIRLQWWREAFAEARAGKPRRHDVLEGLSGADVPEPLIEEMLEAREIEYASEPPASMADFKSYASGSSGALSEAMMAMLGGNASQRAAARSVGTAFGIVGLLRATAFQARHGRVLLPGDALEAAGTNSDAVKSLRAGSEIAKAAWQIAKLAEDELAKTRMLPSDRTLRAPLLLGALASAYLKRLERIGFEILTGDTSLAPLRKQIAVGWASFRGKF
jgi:NADH dehydrogenase [ubiquinone] 1 alpha subcomplex assembly factor 6